MSIPQDVVDSITHQNERIFGLMQQVSALQYMLAQTMTIALRSHPNKHAVLTDMQVFFAEKAQASNIYAGSGDKGFELAEGIFKSVKASLD